MYVFSTLTYTSFMKTCNSQPQKNCNQNPAYGNEVANAVVVHHGNVYIENAGAKTNPSRLLIPWRSERLPKSVGSFNGWRRSLYNQ